MELDWSGQFRSEINYVGNYLLDSSDAATNVDPTRSAAGGYYITPGGSHDSTFETLFLRLRPKLVVNDNIYIKSEWWLGNPIFGFFGTGAPNSRYHDLTQYYSSQNAGSTITAQRYWAEFVTDFGTFQIGRAPLQWGLGVVWNSGDSVWDYYQSTGDLIRWVAKFGKFSVIPAFISYGIGTANNNPTVAAASSSVSDVSVAIKYEDPDNETEAGVNAIRRFGGSGQTTYYVLSPTAVGGNINYTLWDLYAKKTVGRLSIGAEIPIVSSGDLAGISYSTWALAGEVKFRQSDTFHTDLKAGYVPGQQDFTGTSPGSYGAFYFNPGYSLGMMFFNYQFANFATGGSPYDNPLTNAFYAQLAETWNLSDKWAWKVMGTYANALQTATTGQNFWNTWTRSPGGTAVGNQGSNLGFEIATDLAFQWDEFFTFRLDVGYFVPGSFYAFSNAATPNATNPTFGVSTRVGINF